MKIFTSIRTFKSELQTLDYIELYTGSNFSVAWSYEIDDIIKYFLNLTVCFLLIQLWYVSVVLSQDLLLLWLQQLKHLLLICCKLLRTLKVIELFSMCEILEFKVNINYSRSFVCTNYLVIVLQPTVSTEAKKISIYLNMVG